MPTDAGRERHDPPVEVVVDVLRERFDELLDVMCEAVRAKSAAYASLRDRAGFRASVARTAHLYAATVESGGGVPTDATAALHVVGAERSRQGVPEEEMLAAVRWAAQAGAAFLIRAAAERCADVPATAEVAGVVSTSTFEFVATVQQALATGWRTAEADTFAAGGRSRATLVDRLLEGGWSEAQLYDFARAEGVDLRPPCVPLLVTAGAWVGGGSLRTVAAELAASGPGVVVGAPRAAPVPHVVVVAGGTDEARLPAMLTAAEESAQAHRVIVVAGPSSELLADVPTAYREAAARLECARAERRWPGLLRGERLRVYGLLARLTMEERVDLCLATLDRVLRLRPSKAEELFSAFEAVGEAGGKLGQAAALLGPGVNAHTVRYRLRRLEELTGLRCDIDGERLLLGLAVRAYRGWVAAALAEEVDRPPVTPRRHAAPL